MLDERLLPEENKTLQGEDVYDILDVFESFEDANAHIAREHGLDPAKIHELWEQQPCFDEDDCLIGIFTLPDSPCLEYYWFSTDRVVLVQGY